MKSHYHFQLATFLVLAQFLMVFSSLADPSITGVTAKQRYPWNGKVDISYTVSGDIGQLMLSVKAEDHASGTTYTAASSALSGDMGTAAGAHHIVWDLNAQGLEFKSNDVVFMVAYAEPYCVIDLSAGANAASYPVTYLDAPPSGGFNTDEYKTTKLVLKRIEAGTFIMGDNQSEESHRVTLTKPFYFGLFEVTQKQYSLVTGSNPSNFSGDKRPVEKVSYNAIRGSSNGAQWPASNAVDSDSFLGKLRARTGLDFDLPTEAQWEYACRAGTTTDYNNGSNYGGNYSNDSNLNLLGRYYGNLSDGKGGYTDAHTSVGSYLPNAWGLYDMHGNVWEWCLDWYGTLAYGTDPKGSSSGSYRVTRGGGWYGDADYCRSSDRLYSHPSSAYDYNGFRLVRTLLD